MEVKITSRQGAVGPSNHATLKPATKPNMKDFELVGVNLKRIENAVIASCNYKMKPEAAAKATKGKDYLDYDNRYPTEEHSFQTHEEAAEFVKSAILGTTSKDKGDED